jgi:hypothetical protein
MELHITCLVLLKIVNFIGPSSDGLQFKLGMIMLSIDDLKQHMEQIEQAIQQSLANHNGLLGRLETCKYLLDLATKISNEVAPGSSVTEALDAVDAVASTVESATQASAPAPAADVQQS